MKISNTIRNNMMSLLVILYGCTTVTPVWASEETEVATGVQTEAVAKLPEPATETEETTRQPEPAKEKEEEKVAKEKAWYRKILDHKKGIVILSMSLAALGATIYFMHSESAREQLKNSTLSTYAGQVLGAFGTVGSVLWNFGKGSLAALMVPLTYIPGRIGEAAYGAAAQWGFLLTSSSIKGVVSGAAIGTAIIVMMDKTASMYREYREQQYHPDPKEQQLIVQRLSLKINDLQKDAQTLLKALVPFSEILKAENWKKAQRLVRELDTIRTQSWKLDIRNAILIHELILERLEDIQEINVLILAFKLWEESQTRGGFNDNWSDWEVVLKNLLSFLESVEKSLKPLEISMKEKFQKVPKSVSSREDIIKWKEAYIDYYKLSIFLAQINVSQSLIDDVIKTQEKEEGELYRSSYLIEKKTEYEKLKKTYGDLNKRVSEIVNETRTIIGKVFNIKYDVKEEAVEAKEQAEKAEGELEITSDF